MADITTTQVALAFLSALGGAAFNQICTMFYTRRKERLDRENSANQKRSEYHLRRREHLANLISHLNDAKWNFDKTHNIQGEMRRIIENPDPNVPEELLLKRIQSLGEDKLNQTIAGSKSLSDALLQADLYGHLPPQYNFPIQSLRLYVEITTAHKLRNNADENISREERNSDGMHIYFLIRDLHNLMEEELRQYHAVGVKATSTVATDLPYLSNLAPVMPVTQITPDNIDFDHMEKYALNNFRVESIARAQEEAQQLEDRT